MKGGYGPRAARRRDSCTVRNRRTRMSAARLWEGLAPALNYHYTDTSKAFFAAPPTRENFYRFFARRGE